MKRLLELPRFLDDLMNKEIEKKPSNNISSKRIDSMDGKFSVQKNFTSNLKFNHSIVISPFCVGIGNQLVMKFSNEADSLSKIDVRTRYAVKTDINLLVSDRNFALDIRFHFTNIQVIVSIECTHLLHVCSV